MSEMTWSVRISFVTDRVTHTTRAAAVLTAGLDHLTGLGTARKNASDVDDPGIGAELAAARALADVAGQLELLAAARLAAAIPDEELLLVPNPITG